MKRFAERQKETLKNTEIEIHPGFVTGQKVIPVDAAGCYVPGGRYSHIASAIMTVTTAKVAAVNLSRRAHLLSQMLALLRRLFMPLIFAVPTK